MSKKRDAFIDSVSSASSVSSVSFFLHLGEIQFDRRLAVEDEHHHGELPLVYVYRVHRAFVVLEGAVDNDDKVADLEVALELRFLLAHPPLNDAEFLRGDGDGDVARSHEARDVRSIAH